MADLDDVMAMLAGLAESAVYPSGTSAPSVSGAPIQVMVGWPKANALDAFLKPGGVAGARGGTIVSVYAVPGTSSDPGQVFDWIPGVLTASSAGLTADVEGNVITLSGAPDVGDNAVVMASGAAYAYTAQAGDTAATVASALAALIQGSTASGSVLTLHGAYSVSCQTGGAGTVAERLYRQRMQFQLTVWAPNPGDRAIVAAAIDVAIKSNLTIDLPDTSEAIIVYQGTRLSDGSQLEGEYRRDLIFFVTWDTFRTDSAVEILAPQITLSPALPSG